MPSDRGRVDFLYAVFKDAWKSKLALIVLDNIDLLVQAVGYASQVQFSHPILHCLMTLLQTTPPPGAQLLVVATTALHPQDGAYSVLHLGRLFRSIVSIPALQAAGIRRTLETMKVNRADGVSFNFPVNFNVVLRDVIQVGLAARSQALGKPEPDAGASGPASARPDNDMPWSQSAAVSISQDDLDDLLDMYATPISFGPPSYDAVDDDDAPVRSQTRASAPHQEL